MNAVGSTAVTALLQNRQPAPSRNRRRRHPPPVQHSQRSTRNFYEDEMMAADVADALDDVEALLDKLRPMLP